MYGVHVVCIYISLKTPVQRHNTLLLLLHFLLIACQVSCYDFIIILTNYEHLVKCIITHLSQISKHPVSSSATFSCSSKAISVAVLTSSILYSLSLFLSFGDLDKINLQQSLSIHTLFFMLSEVSSKYG